MRLSPFAAIDRWLAPAPSPERVGWIGGHVFAHRGLHGHGVVENSASAARAAIAAGLGIECDIQRSADGRPMVFHDWDLQRLTGRPEATGALAENQIRALRYTGTGEDPITLPDLLELVEGQVPLLIEIKSRRGYDVERTCSLVRDALRGYRGEHGVMSFDPRVSRWFWRNSPQTVRGLVVTEEKHKGLWGDMRRHGALWTARPEFLAYDVRDLPGRFPAAQRARGLAVATWTVRSAGQRALAALHADAPIAEGGGLESAA